MERSRRKTIEGRIAKASNYLQIAKDQLKSFTRNSEVVEASQECIELSVKSILSMFNIKYSPSHGWDQDKKQFAAIAKQIRERNLLERLAAHCLDSTIPLPRLLFLTNFWAQFYITAKYGFEAENLASAKDLFNRDEAELAVKHAEECCRAASQILYLEEERLSAIIAPCEDSAS